MRLILPTFEIIEQKYPNPKDCLSNYDFCSDALKLIYKQIELASRTCYKSEDKITDDSARSFVQRMIDSKHYAMLEHGTVYLLWGIEDENHNKLIEHYGRNPYSKLSCTYPDGVGDYSVTTNLRVLVENNWLDDLQYLTTPEGDFCTHEKRITVKFTCDCGVAREFCRHRAFSFAQESTRYCNYARNKFNNELTFVLPCWNINNAKWLTALETTEQSYMALLNDGWKPEQARNVLPFSLKTELVMTGFVEDWIHFFDLRADGTTGKPHPQAEELAKPLKEEFIKRGYINNNK